MKKYLILIVFGVFILSHPVRADMLNDQQVFFIDPQYDIAGRTQVTATMRAVMPHIYFYVTNDYWSGLSQEGQARLQILMNALGNEFENRIYPIETGFFGSEPNPGIDNDPHITFVLSNLRPNVGGYFDSTNAYPKSQLATSNEREMFFLNTAQFTDASRLMPFLAHEFQHLISFNQKEKLRGVSDDIWLNELRSEYAVTLLGYNSPYEGSNLQRRDSSFVEQPSDSLTEWKNFVGDYGQVALFGEYLATHWSPRVIADTLTTSSTGITSVNEALAKNGFQDSFDAAFVSWMIANNQRIAPTELISRLGDADTVHVATNLKDWEQHWYDLRQFAPGNNGVLEVTFDSSALSSIRVPYVLFRTDGSTSLQTATAANGVNRILIDGIGTTVSRVVLMPYKGMRLAGFLSEEPANMLTMRFRRVAVAIPVNATPEQYDLEEGDFIRAYGDNDVFIVNAYGYKRLVLSPKICLQYGHLGARGCFGAIKNVTPQTRDAFITSHYYTNGETNDGKVQHLMITGDDTATLLDLHTHLSSFYRDGFDARAVFRINSREQRSYTP